MFEAYFYGLAKDGYGSIMRIKLGEEDVTKLELEKAAVVVLEDSITSIKRYIFCISERASIASNEVSKFYRATIFNGSEGKKHWTQIISHIDSEIYTVTYDQLIEILLVISTECARNAPFWHLDNKVKEYIKSKDIK